MKKVFVILMKSAESYRNIEEMIILLEILIRQILIGLFLKNSLIRSAIQFTDFHLCLKTVQTI